MKTPSFFKWLNEPYPLVLTFRNKFITAVFIGLFVFLFLSIFQPFGLYISKTPFLSSLGYGVIAFVVTFLVLIFYPAIFKLLSLKEELSIGKIFLISLITEFFIAIANKEFYAYELGYYISLKEHLFFAFVIGFISVVIYLVIHHNILVIRSQKKEKQSFIVSDKKKFNDLNKITITEGNNKNKIIFFPKNLIYLTSQGNYVSLFLLNEKDEITEKVIRGTLSKIAAQLEGKGRFIRCHRSYIVNVYWFREIKGNARSPFLISLKFNKKIPISRKFPKEQFKLLVKNM